MNAAYVELKKRIENGDLRPGDTLPSSAELQRRYGMGADDVQRAVSELIYEGLLHRGRPAPTEELMVPSYRLWGTLTGEHSITKEAKRRGQQAGVEVTRFEFLPAWSRVVRLLRLSQGEEVVILERLRSADGDPVAIEVSYYPARLYPGISKDMFTATGAGQSSFEVMEKQFGYKSARAEDEVGVASLEAREAGLLRVAPGTPVLVRYRTTFSEQDVAIKASRAVWKFWAAYKMGL